MSDDRWFTTTFNVSAEAATLAEADTMFDQIEDAIGEVLGEDRAWSVFGGEPVEVVDTEKEDDSE